MAADNSPPTEENLDTFALQLARQWWMGQGAKIGALILAAISGWLLKHGMDRADAVTVAGIIVSALGSAGLVAWEMLKSWAQHQTALQHATFIAQAAKRMPIS